MFSSYASNSTEIMDENITYSDKGSWDGVTYPGIADNDINSNEKINRVLNVGTFGKYFTANFGQVGNKDVKFYIQGKVIWFTSSGVVFELVEPSEVKSSLYEKFEMPLRNPEDLEKENELRRSGLVTFDFVNCNKINLIGIDELPHRSNFFYGNDSSKWRTDVPNYREIYFENIYDNIDLRYYFNEDGLKYDFIVHPFGNPEDIQVELIGTDNIMINNKNELEIKTEIGTLFDKYLFVYQQVYNELHQISANFELLNSSKYGFSIDGDYNSNHDLIIDPLLYSSFFGGIENDVVTDIEIDEEDDIIVAGTTFSPDFPITNGSYDVTNNSKKDIFLLKMNGDNHSLVYSTYIGGKGDDTIHGLALDSDNYPYLTGGTSSSDFPMTSNAMDNIYNPNSASEENVFLLQLYPNGSSLFYSSFFGYNYAGVAYDIAVDLLKNIYLAGHLIPSPPDQPVIFIYKFSPQKLFVGGYSFSQDNLIPGISIAINKNGDIIFVGCAFSEHWQVSLTAYDGLIFPGAYRMFITRCNLNSPVITSTFFGPINTTRPTKVLIDESSNIMVTGYTLGNDLPLTPGSLQCPKTNNYKGFISKLDSNLTSLLYSTYFNAGSSEKIYDAVLDLNDTIYFTGVTTSTDFPIPGYSFDWTYNGGGDAFLAALDISNSQIKYSTYIGGNERDIGYGIAIDDDANVFITGEAGRNFPTTPDSYEPNFNGGEHDGFLSSFAPSLMDLKISKSKEFRGNSVTLTSNVSRIPSLEKTYTPHFQYTFTGQNEWKDDLINSPTYINDRWMTVFTISKNAKLGYYSFRVHYNDTNDVWTKWLYLNGSLWVLNNLPRVDCIDLLKFEVVIGETNQLIVNGSDFEDELIDISFEPEYRYSESVFWDPLIFDKVEFQENKYAFTFSIGPGNEYGNYHFRMKANDSDSGKSDWENLLKPLLLLSAPPKVLSIELSKIQIYRNDMVEIYINCSDVDSSYEELYMELQYRHFSDNDWKNLSADPINNRWEGLLNSKRNWQLGNYSFRTRAIDMESNPSGWYYLNDSLLILNNNPELWTINDIPGKTERGMIIEVSIDAKDVENKEEELSIEFEYQLPGESQWNVSFITETYYSENRWNYKFFIPFSAPLGYYSFRARSCDLDDAWSDHSYLNDSMLVFNIAPEVVAFEQSPYEVFRTETVIITAEGYDLETAIEKLECFIYYSESNVHSWKELKVSFNETTGFWNSELVTTSSSILGYYSFMVQFIDHDGVSSKAFYYNQTVWIQNNLPIISDELDDIEIGEEQKILTLTDFGFDVETAKSDLRWIVDQSTVNTKLFQITTNNIGNHEIIINPEKSKEGKNDITIELIDADNGRVIKNDVTIIVNSQSVGGIDSPDEDDPVSKLISGDSYWLYIIILIILITIIILFIYFRRRKQWKQEVKEGEEDLLQETEETKTESTDGVLLPDTESALPEIDTPLPVPVPVIEEPSKPVPVPMPVEAEKPQLPASTAQVPTEASELPQDQSSITEPEIEVIQSEEEPEFSIQEAPEDDNVYHTPKSQNENNETKEET
jgi:hypothetical protein